MPHECFADEIAIDFPNVELAVERMRDAFLGERAGDHLHVVVRREVLDRKSTRLNSSHRL